MRSMPPLREPFAWEGHHIGVRLGHYGRALFTTRRGGVSRGVYESLDLGIGPPGEEFNATEENYRRLAETIGVARDAITQGRQVHGSAVTVVDGTSPGGIQGACDGLVTTALARPLVAITADCVPVAIASRRGVAIAHAGWRGLAAGILETAVARLTGVGAHEMHAAIGPGAGPCCYACGNEVHRAFAGIPGASIGSHVDLKCVAAAQLRAAGVDVVDDVGMCTLCSDPSLFFSHRRDGGTTGRQAGVVWVVDDRG